jgi:UDP-N-acetylglucosamine 2-epimerase (non-hydrolysing)
MRPFRLLLVVGARPNFVKIAPIVRELKRWPDHFAWRLIHTGQHYDAAMSDVFFRQLGIPRPDLDLGVGSGSHAQQTAAIMTAFEPIVLEWQPDMVLVVGDVNSTIACALVAAKLGTRIAHVEAGLRSFDRAMPEEINRVLTDQLSDLLFTTEESAHDNLLREGIAPDRIHFVGNVMIDTLLEHRDHARSLNIPQRYGLTRGGYAVLTLHRPSNVDDTETLLRLLTALDEIAAEVPIVFPVHPRTRTALARSPRASALLAGKRFRLLDPLGYVEFLGLMADSRLVLTDSGGVQEETTMLGVPCLTLRDTTERPVTISHGTNQVVGTDPDRILEAWRNMRNGDTSARIPALWDGEAARRIVDVLRHVALGRHEAADAVEGLLAPRPAGAAL